MLPANSQSVEKREAQLMFALPKEQQNGSRTECGFSWVTRRTWKHLPANTVGDLEGLHEQVIRNTPAGGNVDKIDAGMKWRSYIDGYFLGGGKEVAWRGLSTDPWTPFLKFWQKRRSSSCRNKTKETTNGVVRRRIDYCFHPLSFFLSFQICLRFSVVQNFR